MVLENEAEYSILLLLYEQIWRKREHGTHTVDVDFFYGVCVVRVLV